MHRLNKATGAHITVSSTVCAVIILVPCCHVAILYMMQLQVLLHQAFVLKVNESKREGCLVMYACL